MKTLRWFQKEAVAAVQPPDGRKLIVIPTGGGKSLVCAQLCADEVIFGRVLLLVPRKELALQNEKELRELCPDLDIGVCCAGLGRYEYDAAVVIATIQSVYKKLADFDDVTLIIIDECHLITPVGGKMYRAVLERFDTACGGEFPVIGLTATPFRTGTGYLHKGQHALFKRLDYEVKYQTLVDEGFLVPFAKLGSEHAYSDENLHTRGGEFLQAELDVLAEDNAKTKAIVKQFCERAKDRWAWIVFAINVRHAHVIKREMAACGVEAGIVYGDMEADGFDRDYEVACFKAGMYRALINVGVLTTGFDYPALDCVVLCRPMGSPVLFIQCAGRGTRIAAGKVDCLLLDYGGNIGRFGEFGEPEIREKGNSKESKLCPECGERNSMQARRCHACDHKFENMFKKCPECAESVDRTTQHCKTCGYYWPINEEGLDTDGKTIIENKSIWLDLKGTSFRVHKPRSTHPLDEKPDCFVAVHKTVDGATVQEYTFPESYAARHAFEKWWRVHNGKAPAPKTSIEARDRKQELVLPSRIRVIRKGKYFNFEARMFP
jgi:DNA repair protein RadD